MLQFIVIFSLSVTGSLVALTAEIAHRFLMRKARREFITAGPTSGTVRQAARPAPVDPVVTFGAILACYGALALSLVCALPAPLALERTVLTFAFLCVGGLLGEIAKSSSTVQPGADADADIDAEDAAAPAEPPSRGLSFTLALVLNLAFAVLGAGQGLIDVVPPARTQPSIANSQQLQPIFVVAQRPESTRDAVSGAGL